MLLKIKSIAAIFTSNLCERQRTYQLTLMLACCVMFATGSANFANGQVAPAKPPTKEPSDEAGESGPETVTLETKDKVALVCSYFSPAEAKEPTADKAAAASGTKPTPATEEDPTDGKRIIPYIILHDWESSRADTQALATFLSAQGNAVITPDLRGHGESTRVVGVDEQIDAADFKPSEIGATMEDIEACKRFLVKRNNAGELNIDMLAVIAIGKTVPMATQWVVKDWSYAPYNKGIKQGQDAKFLIMIAPEKKLGPFTMSRATGVPIFAGETALPTIVSWSTSGKTAKESQSIYNRLKKRRSDSKEESAETKTLYQAPLPNSSRSGVQIGSDPSLTKLWMYFDKTVSKKIDQNLEKLPWQDRSKAP